MLALDWAQWGSVQFLTFMSQYIVSQPQPAGNEEVYLRIQIGSVDRLSTNKADLILNSFPQRLQGKETPCIWTCVCLFKFLFPSYVLFPIFPHTEHFQFSPFHSISYVIFCFKSALKVILALCLYCLGDSYANGFTWSSYPSIPPFNSFSAFGEKKLTLCVTCF